MAEFNCCEENLSAYIDNELSEDEARMVEMHLQTCFRCNKAIHEMALLSEAVGELNRPAMDPLLTMRILNHLGIKDANAEVPLTGLFESWGILSLAAMSMMLIMPYGYAFLRLMYTIYNKIVLLLTVTVHFSWRIPFGQVNNILGIIFMIGAIIAFYGFGRVYWGMSKKELAS